MLANNLFDWDLLCVQYWSAYVFFRVYARICVPKEVLNLFENAPEKLYPFTIVINVLCVRLCFFFFIFFSFCSNFNDEQKMNKIMIKRFNVVRI